MASAPDRPDFFDLLPDSILLVVLNRVSDIKTLLRCRSLSWRFNSLVPQADSLLLRVDRVISASDHDSPFNHGVSFISALFHSLLASLQHLIPFSPPDTEIPPPLPNSPSQILLGFDAIKSLRIELPSGDLRLHKGTSIKWIARFGKTLHSCVILAFRNGADSGCNGNAGGGLKMRVVWTISALIAASARHYMVADVVNEQPFLSHLVVNDRENEGTMIMDKDGLREFRESAGESPDEINRGGGGMWWRSNRTTVPAVGIRMRHEAKLELSGGMIMEGATLVVVTPAANGGGGQERRSEAEEHGGDDGLAAAAFGLEGVYAEAAAKLLKGRSYILEMNSF